MYPRLRAAAIGGGILGVAAGLLYPAGQGQVFVSVNGFFGGVLAAYLFLHIRPDSTTSLYGNGALVGLLAGPFGGVPMTLVLMITGGQTEFAFPLFLFTTMVVGAVLGPIGGMIGMAIFQTHLALDNSKASRIVAVLGSGLILVGTFLPLVPLPLVGRKSMAFFIAEMSWWGLLAPSMAALGIGLAKTNQVKWCGVAGLVCVLAVLYPFFFLNLTLTRGSELSTLEVIRLSSGSLVEVVRGSGGLVMGGGALLLVVASARAFLPAR